MEPCRAPGCACGCACACTCACSSAALWTRPRARAVVQALGTVDVPECSRNAMHQCHEVIARSSSTHAHANHAHTHAHARSHCPHELHSGSRHAHAHSAPAMPCVSATKSLHARAAPTRTPTMPTRPHACSSGCGSRTEQATASGHSQKPAAKRQDMSVAMVVR